MSSITRLRSPVILGASGAPASMTGTAANTALASIAIPAGLMGVNGVLRIMTNWSFSGAAGNRNPHIHFGGIGGTDYNGSLALGPTSVQTNFITIIANKSATNSQKGTSNNQPATTAMFTGAVDTTAATTLVISANMNVADTGTLESYLVEFFPGV